jgi:hypothetical protein
VPNTKKRQHTILERILEHETPIFGTVSVGTTIIGEALVLGDLLSRPDWGSPELLIMVLFCGTVLNLLLGLVASARGEYGGVRTAASGVALWFLTSLAFFLARGNRLWR